MGGLNPSSLRGISLLFDDLLIFSTAAFAATSALGEKYAVYTKPASGVIMLCLGIALIFFPYVLR